MCHFSNVRSVQVGEGQRGAHTAGRFWKVTRDRHHIDDNKHKTPEHLAPFSSCETAQRIWISAQQYGFGLRFCVLAPTPNVFAMDSLKVTQTNSAFHSTGIQVAERVVAVVQGMTPRKNERKINF